MLSLIFVKLIIMCLGMFFFWIYRVWGSLCFLDLGGCVLSHAREVFSYYVFGYFFSGSFSLFLWDLYYVNVGAFKCVPEVS